MFVQRIEVQLHKLLHGSRKKTLNKTILLIIINRNFIFGIHKNKDNCCKIVLHLKFQHGAIKIV